MKSRKIVLVLHNIRSAHNVGSIFRTADAAGVEKIFLCGITPTPSRFDLFKDLSRSSPEAMVRDSRSNLGRDQETSKIAKTALGAEKTMPWEQCKQTWRLLEKLKSGGVQVIALEQSAKSVDYRKFKPKFLPAGRQVHLALVVGNEVRGLNKQVLKYCDKIIEIPMRGKKESLNVSVAAGIVLFKIIEKKTPKSRSLAS